MPMTTQTPQPLAPTTPVPETRAKAEPTEVPSCGDKIRPYWGDRLYLLFGLGCAALIILMNLYDFLMGLLGY